MGVFMVKHASRVLPKADSFTWEKHPRLAAVSAYPSETGSAGGLSLANKAALDSFSPLTIKSLAASMSDSNHL